MHLTTQAYLQTNTLALSGTVQAYTIALSPASKSGMCHPSGTIHPYGTRAFHVHGRDHNDAAHVLRSIVHRVDCFRILVVLRLPRCLLDCKDRDTTSFLSDLGSPLCALVAVSDLAAALSDHNQVWSLYPCTCIDHHTYSFLALHADIPDVNTLLYPSRVLHFVYSDIVVACESLLMH